MTAVEPRRAVADAYDRIEADGRDGIWISLVERSVALAAAGEVERRMVQGEVLPLAGSTLAVKDNIDVAGTPTTAACPAYAYRPSVSAPVVAALVGAGAVVVGKTNMDQFATGLVGVRSPYGVCPNARWPELIAGGSSSGSAVAVASGLVDLALGTDTAGSGRVPAACNGIVGAKPTRGRLSTLGTVPACASLDCVSVFARSVGDAARAVAIAAATPRLRDDIWRRAVPMRSRPDGRALRLGVPGGPLDVDGDEHAAARFAAAVTHLEATGCELVEVDLDPFVETGRLLYDGSFVAERYEAVGAFVDAHLDEVDPTVGAIIRAAARIPAWAVFRDLATLERLRRRTEATWTAIDALVVPSVPRVPTVAEVLAEPIARNTALGTYTNFVNLLDLCALTVPLPEADATAGADAPPPSITLIGPAGADDVLAAVVESAARR